MSRLNLNVSHLSSAVVIIDISDVTTCFLTFTHDKLLDRLDFEAKRCLGRVPRKNGDGHRITNNKNVIFSV